MMIHSADTIAAIACGGFGAGAALSFAHLTIGMERACELMVLGVVSLVLLIPVAALTGWLGAVWYLGILALGHLMLAYLNGAFTKDAAVSGPTYERETWGDSPWMGG